jgi:hypothetical protein
MWFKPLRHKGFLHFGPNHRKVPSDISFHPESPQKSPQSTALKAARKFSVLHIDSPDYLRVVESTPVDERVNPEIEQPMLTIRPFATCSTSSDGT